MAIFMISIPQSLGFFFLPNFTFLHPFSLLTYSFIIHSPTALATMINFIHIPFHFLISLPIKWICLIYCVIFSLLHYFVPHLICYISSLLIHSSSHFTHYFIHSMSLFAHWLSPAINAHVLFAIFSFYTFFPHNPELKFLLHLPFAFYYSFSQLFIHPHLEYNHKVMS